MSSNISFTDFQNRETDDVFVVQRTVYLRSPPVRWRIVFVRDNVVNDSRFAACTYVDFLRIGDRAECVAMDVHRYGCRNVHCSAELTTAGDWRRRPDGIGVVPLALIGV